MFDIGDVIDGFFRVESILAGGMGVVYICRVLPETEEQARVAIKSFPKELEWNSDVAKRFQREAQLWISLLPHPNIVRADTLMRLGYLQHLWLEYVEGGNLRARLRAKPMEETETLRMALEFCEGMRFLAESAHIVHRDIKPENILLTRTGHIKITDFGIAKSRSGLPHPPVKMGGMAGVSGGDDTGDTILGTPPYMSPEQFEETGTLSPASDVYSFGIVLYEMVVGRRPFSAVSINEWYTRHAFAQPSSPAAVCGAPAALSAIVLKCLEKRPEDRFHDFIALGNALEHYCRATRRSGLQPSRPSVQELEAGMPPVLWYRRGHALTELGRHDDAYECYRRSLVTDPAPFGANAAFAAALQRQGRLAEALPFYEREAAQHPGGLSFCQLAGAYRDAGRPVDALSASRKSVVADGSVIDGATLTTWREHAKLVRELGAAGEYQRAIERIKELLSHAPFDNARSVIGTVVQFAQLDDWDAATAFHVLSIERFPDDPLSWYNFGVSLHRAGDDARAFDAYSRALNLEPHLPWALFARGLLLALHANYAAARADWKLALEALPEHRVSQLIRIVDKKAWAAPQILAVARSLQARLTEGNWFLPYDGFE